MRIEVVGRDVEVTNGIRTHAEEKGEKLTRYFDRIQLVTFKLSKSGKNNIDAECIVDVEMRDDFIATATAETAHAAIDEAVHKATRQLTDFKEKLKLENR